MPIVTLSVTSCSAFNQEMTSQSSNGGGKECTLTETNTIHRNYCKNVSACSNRREVLLLSLDHLFPGTAIRWDSLVWQADTNSLGNRIERNKINSPVRMVVHTYSSINTTCTMYVLTSHWTSNAWWWQTRHTTNKLAETRRNHNVYRYHSVQAPKDQFLDRSSQLLRW